MRKEVIVAILVGGLFGVVLAFGIWRSSFVFRDKDIVQNETPAGGVLPEDNTGDNSPSPHASAGISIVSPNANSVVSNGSAEVKGLAARFDVVVITNNAEAQIVKVGADDSFVSEVELEDGINEIAVAGFDSEGTAQDDRVRVVFADIESESAGGLFAETGIITDIIENSVQIKDDEGAIKQILINDDTLYENVIDTPKEIELSDLAIGDYLIVITDGTGNEVNSMVGRKVLVSEATSDKGQSQVIMGEVLELSNDDFIVRDLNQEWSLDATGGGVRVSGVGESGEIGTIRLSDIEEGEQIIVVGQLEDGEIQVSLIHLVG